MVYIRETQLYNSYFPVANHDQELCTLEVVSVYTLIAWLATGAVGVVSYCIAYATIIL